MTVGTYKSSVDPGLAASEQLSPEGIELQRKITALQDLKSKLADQELELATVRGELVAFQRHYLERVGPLYARLDELTARIARLRYRRRPRDEAAQRAVEEAEAQAEQSAQAVDELQPSQSGGKFEPSETLGKAYRAAARKLHPDLTMDEAEKARRKRVMSELNQAYEDCDEARIRRILDDWRVSPDQVQGEDTAAELVRVIRTIAMVERRLATIRDEIEALHQSDLYQLKAQVDDAAEAGRDLLAEMAKQLKHRIRDAAQTLESLGEEEAVG
jgi:uncharacterized coiled-coil DUF342 family protein